MTLLEWFGLAIAVAASVPVVAVVAALVYMLMNMRRWP